MRYIHQPELLNDAITLIQSSPWAALDTEGDSLHHYIEKLCLVQISIPGEDLVVDPLVPLDLRALMRVLEKKPLILHGSDFDLRILKKNYAFNPSEVFDTMIAAQLLGYDKQGLADLALKHCEVHLPKSAQKADWSERPLDEKLLTYAANDTHFLKVIADLLTDELKALGRLEWHRQSCQKLVRSIQAAKEDKADTDTAWQIKGSKELRGVSLTILKELWLWREEEARKKDRPPFKVLNSEILIEIANWAGENADADVALMPKAVRPLRNEYRQTVNETVQKAKTMPQAHWNRKSNGQKPRLWSEESKSKLGLLKTERDKLGAELAIQPSLVATNAILETLALDLPKNRESLEKLGCLMPWQIELAGSRFLKILCS